MELLKPSCAKELEQLCGCLQLLAGALPPAFAGEPGRRCLLRRLPMHCAAWRLRLVH